MKKMWMVVTTLKARVTKLTEEKNVLEEQLNDLNAYTRRQNIEIRNIPETVKDNELETHCINVLASLDIYVKDHDIVGVHRLGKFNRGRTRSTIIRFVNRKNAYDVLDNWKWLRNTQYKGYFVTENLCPTYRKTSCKTPV